MADYFDQTDLPLPINSRHINTKPTAKQWVNIVRVPRTGLEPAQPCGH
jgi:hypothetical protein